MHEMSIAQSIIDIVKEEMIRHHVNTLHSIRVQIGRLSAIVPASLSFCFEIMTADTELEGAELLMEIVPLQATCMECNETFEVMDYTFICPHCKSKDIQTLAGQDLTVVEINAI